MASDDDYMAFLNKANQDTTDSSGGNAQASSNATKTKFKTTDSGEEVPKVIQDALKGEVYATDADEPFEGVSLKWSGNGLPDEVAFAKLIEHWDAEKADISIMDPTDWDAHGKYEKIIKAVEEASRGSDVRVYRVVRDHTRVEYWLVSSDKGRIVGVKALGIES